MYLRLKKTLNVVNAASSKIPRFVTLDLAARRSLSGTFGPVIPFAPWKANENPDFLAPENRPEDCCRDIVPDGSRRAAARLQRTVGWGELTSDAFNRVSGVLRRVGWLRDWSLSDQYEMMYVQSQ